MPSSQSAPLHYELQKKKSIASTNGTGIRVRVCGGEKAALGSKKATAAISTGTMIYKCHSGPLATSTIHRASCARNATKTHGSGMSASKHGRDSFATGKKTGTRTAGSSTTWSGICYTGGMKTWSNTITTRTADRASDQPRSAPTNDNMATVTCMSRLGSCSMARHSLLSIFKQTLLFLSFFLSSFLSFILTILSS